jgi:hypothetical protein
MCKRIKEKKKDNKKKGKKSRTKCSIQQIDENGRMTNLMKEYKIKIKIEL